MDSNNKVKRRQCVDIISRITINDDRKDWKRRHCQDDSAEIGLSRKN